MNKILKKIVSSIGGLILLFTGFSTAFAGMPAPLDDPGKVKIALVRLSTGDFFKLIWVVLNLKLKQLVLILEFLTVEQDAALQLIWLIKQLL